MRQMDSSIAQTSVYTGTGWRLGRHFPKHEKIRFRREERAALHGMPSATETPPGGCQFTPRGLGETEEVHVDVEVESSTSPMLPPSAASGEQCPIDRPEVPPEKRPSVINAQALPRPFDFR